ncbi:MAG: glycoside hydrolase family 15 protein, partial [Terriglobales bacterium]
MDLPPCESVAFGAPGMPPRWTRGAKDAVGTAYAAASRLWFTLAQGTLTEIYFPSVDRPQVRDLQYLFTDGATFFLGERRDCDSRAEAMTPHALGFRVTSEDRQGRFRCHKEILADPHLSCLLMHTQVEVEPRFGRSLRVFALCAPHLDGIGWHNTAQVVEMAGRKLLLAHRNSIWMAIGATVPLRHASAGYVGASDGWTDIAAHLRPTLEFDCAPDGNVALVAELELNPNNSQGAGHRNHTFTLGLAFGFSQQAAVNTLLQ